MLPDDVTVRLFAKDEWPLFKAVRLKALENDPAVFGSSFESESAYPDDRWRAWILDTSVGVFGVFCGGEVIGMTGVALKADRPGDAVLWGSWLEKEWRGKGLSRKMYASRIDWARENSAVKRLVVSHRKSNNASKRANQKNGFVWTHDEEKTWHDGRSEPNCFYELKVR